MEKGTTEVLRWWKDRRMRSRQEKLLNLIRFGIQENRSQKIQDNMAEALEQRVRTTTFPVF